MRPALVALLLAVLTACGDTTTSNPPPNHVTANMLAIELGCTGDDGTDPNAMSCEFNGSYLGITTYDNKADLQTDINVATSATTVLVNTNELWMIDAPDDATLEAAQAIVGGNIR